MGSVPRASIAVASGNRHNRTLECVEAIFSQAGIESCEVILIDGSPGDHSDLYARFPGIRYMRAINPGSVAVPRLEALKAARAPLVLFLEDHVEPQAGWLLAVLRAFESSEKIAMVNYVIAPTPGASYIYRSLQVMQYGHWMLPIESGPITYACHQNLAYRRELVLQLAEENFELFESEFLMHRRLLKDGWTLWLAADAVIDHENYSSLATGCKGFFAFKQLVGAGRAATHRWPRWKNWLWAAGMPLSAFVLIGRLARSIAPRPALWGEFLAALPVMIFAHGVGSFYEARGHLMGFEQCRKVFLDFESNVDRTA